MQLYNFVSFAGIFILLTIAWLISRFVFGNRDIINWPLICWGIGLQILFALFIFIVPAGITLFQAINDLAVIVLSTASDGAKFVFGTLAAPPGTEESLGFILAFQAFPTIIFFSALVSILYYYNILPFIIRQFAKLFTRLMKISGAEALCAASNIFVGIPIEDAKIISQIIGERIILTEVASYQDLAIAISNTALKHPRSAVVTSYALCGFAHVASMAIFVGGVTAIAPERTAAVSKVAFKALIAATLACLLTACIAGTFFTNTSILFG